MEVSKINSEPNSEPINYRNFVSLIELECHCEDSVSFSSLCKFLRTKGYSVIPVYVFKDLLELKRRSIDKKFCIRDSSDKSTREEGRTMNTFEVCLINFYS